MTSSDPTRKAKYRFLKYRSRHTSEAWNQQFANLTILKGGTRKRSRGDDFVTLALKRQREECLHFQDLAGDFIKARANFYDKKQIRTALLLLLWARDHEDPATCEVARLPREVLEHFILRPLWKETMEMWSVII